MFRAGDLTIVLNGALSGSTGAFELVFPVESGAASRCSGRARVQDQQIDPTPR
jgi:hypothetical protein